MESERPFPDPNNGLLLGGIFTGTSQDKNQKPTDRQCQSVSKTGLSTSGLSCCEGMGGWELAAGDEWTQVFAAEKDQHARKVFEADMG